MTHVILACSAGSNYKLCLQVLVQGKLVTVVKNDAMGILPHVRHIWVRGGQGRGRKEQEVLVHDCRPEVIEGGGEAGS